MLATVMVSLPFSVFLQTAVGFLNWLISWRNDCTALFNSFQFIHTYARTVGFLFFGRYGCTVAGAVEGVGMSSADDSDCTTSEEVLGRSSVWVGICRLHASYVDPRQLQAS